VRTGAICAVFLVWCSLGATIRYHGHDSKVPTPWKFIRKLPLFDSLLPSRLGVVAVPFIALVLTLAVEHAVLALRRSGKALPALPTAALLGVFAALVPLTPSPLRVAQRPAIPHFLTNGHWKQYVREGHGLVFVPPPNPDHAEAMAWQSDQLIDFTMPGGYFLGPVGPQKIGFWPFSDRPTAQLLFDIGYKNEDVPLPANAPQAALDDLRYWGADAVVLPDGQANHDKLLKVTTALLGDGVRVDDVWVWDVRNRVGG
jgi:dolichyl-phosphate beta-glucosyltransferase